LSFAETEYKHGFMWVVEEEGWSPMRVAANRLLATAVIDDNVLSKFAAEC